MTVMFEPMRLAEVEVQRIVSGRDLHRSGAEAQLHPLIGHDGNGALHERQDHPPPHEARVSLIPRIHRHAAVAEHRLRTRRCHHDEAAAVLEGVAEAPQVAVAVDVIHFLIGECRLVLRTPVDDPGAAVDQPLLIQPTEGLSHGSGEPLIQGEPLSRPVYRAAEALELTRDGVMAGMFPRPHALQERFTAHLLAPEPLGG